MAKTRALTSSEARVGLEIEAATEDAARNEDRPLNAAEQENQRNLQVERRRSDFRNGRNEFVGRAGLENGLERTLEDNLDKVLGTHDDGLANEPRARRRRDEDADDDGVNTRARVGPAEGDEQEDDNDEQEQDRQQRQKKERQKRRAELEQQTTRGDKGKTREATDKEEPIERTPEQRKALARAVAALRFEKFTDQDLDVMSDEQILRLGAPMAERQAAESQRRDAEARARNGNATAARTDSPADKGRNAPPAEDDDVETAVKGFLDVAGEEYAEPFRKVVGALKQGFAARVESAEADLERVLDMQARQSLRERFPQLDDPKNDPELLETMADLASTGRYRRADYPRLMRDSCWVLYGEAVARTEGTRRSTVREARRQGSPTLTHRDRGSERARPKSLDERLDAAYESIERGATMAEGQRAFRG